MAHRLRKPQTAPVSGAPRETSVGRLHGPPGCPLRGPPGQRPNPLLSLAGPHAPTPLLRRRARTPARRVPAASSAPAAWVRAGRAGCRAVHRTGHTPVLRTGQGSAKVREKRPAGTSGGGAVRGPAVLPLSRLRGRGPGGGAPSREGLRPEGARPRGCLRGLDSVSPRCLRAYGAEARPRRQPGARPNPPSKSRSQSTIPAQYVASRPGAPPSRSGARRSPAWGAPRRRAAPPRTAPAATGSGR